MKLISEGAEAKVYLDSKNLRIIKTRTKKAYRVPTLDNAIIKTRTKREAQILQKAATLGIKVPKLYNVDISSGTIEMEYLKFDSARKHISKSLIENIAKNIASLHNAEICHGDITLENILYDKNNNQIYLIDFGLSYNSKRLEDYATDLFVLKETLLAEYDKKLWDYFEKSYTKQYKSDDVIKRLRLIEKRRRNAN